MLRLGLGHIDLYYQHRVDPKRRSYLVENVAALDIELTAEDLTEFNQIAPVGITAGARYPESSMAAVNR